MFEQNNVGVRLRNPVAEFVSTLSNDDPRLDDMFDIVNNIKAIIESQGGMLYVITSITLMFSSLQQTVKRSTKILIVETKRMKKAKKTTTN